MEIKESAIKAIVRTPLFKMRVVQDKTKKVQRTSVNVNDALNEYYEDLELQRSAASYEEA